MKKYEFKLSNSFLNLFFPKERIKTRLRIIEILMEATRYMLVAPGIIIDNQEVVGKIILYVDKMSRLFFLKNDKYYSIVFPFFVFEDEEGLKFSYNNEIDVDSHLISNVVSIIKSDVFLHQCSLDFAEPIYDIENKHIEKFWFFLRELLLMEDGYLRYDKDEENFLKAKEKGEEDKHPLHHYDVFYTSNATFKIGLKANLVDGDFIDFLDTNTSCGYIGRIK